jgi:hypothetical protein
MGALYGKVTARPAGFTTRRLTSCSENSERRRGIQRAGPCAGDASIGSPVRAHAVSDTRYGTFPFAVPTFLRRLWNANRRPQSG